jgi:hypothetical protein
MLKTAHRIELGTDRALGSTSQNWKVFEASASNLTFYSEDSWLARFMREGLGGLLRDKTRPPGRKPLDPAVIERVVALTAEDPANHASDRWPDGQRRSGSASLRCSGSEQAQP